MNIETSTTVCSLALQEGERMLGSCTLYTDRSHAGQLAVLTEKLLDVNNVKASQLVAVAVASGPGSYTGLRIGTSFAKGLCYSLGIPLLAIGSLEGLAAGVVPEATDGDLLIAMMDARRMEVYLQVFNRYGKPLTESTPFLLEEEDLGKWLDQGRCLIFGNGSEKAKKVIDHPNAQFIDGMDMDARFMCSLSWEKFSRDEFADLAYFEPEYLKEFRATKPKKLF